MSNIQYGLISRVDSDTIEKTFELIFKDFPDEIINYSEVGLYNGRTTSGVNKFLQSKNKQFNLIGIDNFKDKEELVFYPPNAKLIQGSSIEVYNQLPDNSQHFILIDGNHSFPYVIADFFCYSQKVIKGGYICFHDAAPHSQNVSYQRMGSEDDMDMYISVRKALQAVGLLKDTFSPSAYIHEAMSRFNWELVFDEADLNDMGGGVLVFKKLH